MKKVVVLFNAPGSTSDQYEKIWDDLRAAGQSNPKGLISHVGAAKPDGSWFVCDVWESEEAFKEFGKILMPIIIASGMQATEPMILPAHYVYTREKEGIPA